MRRIYTLLLIVLLMKSCAPPVQAQQRIPIVVTSEQVAEDGSPVMIRYSLAKQKEVQDVFGKSLSKKLSLWNVTVSNYSGSSVSVSEEYIRHYALGLNIDAKTPALAEMIVRQSQGQSGWRKAVDVVNVSAVVVTLFLNLDVVRDGKTIIGSGGVQALNMYTANSDRLRDFLLGKAVPGIENYYALRVGEVVVLSPGEVGSSVMFSGLYAEQKEPVVRETQATR